MESFFLHKDAYPVLAVLCVCVCVTISFVAHYWYKVRRAEMELSVKQAMIERGMSAAEICAVIEAGDNGNPVVNTLEAQARVLKAKAQVRDAGQPEWQPRQG